MERIHHRRGEDKVRVTAERSNKSEQRFNNLNATSKTLDVPHGEPDAGVVGHRNERLGFSLWLL